MITATEGSRLDSTAERVRTLNAETTAERSRRNRIVRELIDRGEKYRAVARVAGLSVAAIASIMSYTESE